MKTYRISGEKGNWYIHYTDNNGNNRTISFSCKDDLKRTENVFISQGFTKIDE